MRFLGFRSFVLPVFILITSRYSVITMGDPRTTLAGFTCTPSSPPSQSTLANNFVPAMANLSSLIDEKQSGTVVMGSGPSAVFALAQCFRDLNSTECTLCYSEIRSVLPKCYPRSGGRIFLDGCFGRYENFSFFDVGVDSLTRNNCSFQRNSSQPFLSFMEGIRNVIELVSSGAQNNNGFSVATHFTPNLSLYALAQCWENLNKNTCNSCLQSAASSITSCPPAEEGRSLHAGCYMRYSTSLFWNADQIPPPNGKRNHTWAILVGVTAAFLVLTSVWALKIVLFKRNPKQWTGPSHELPLNISTSKLNFKYRELRKATRNFDPANKLGQGSYGSVYKGVLSDGREVAVKRLFMNTRQWSGEFFNEVDLISQVHHKNLVRLLGCSLDGPESLLVYDYHFNRSLDRFIFGGESRARLLGWSARFEIINGVAEGLRYLHEESAVRIIHRDIKASNVLLDHNLKPKITDFGLARSFALDQTHLNTGVVGTLGYMAPEYVIHGHLTEKADVYSFGILVLEIITRRRCTSTDCDEPLLSTVWKEFRGDNVISVVDEMIRGHGDGDIDVLRALRVGLLCVQATPSLRPSMSNVLEILRTGDFPGSTWI